MHCGIEHIHKGEDMNNGAHDAIDARIAVNDLNPNNMKNKVKSETLDLYDLMQDPMFNMGTAIFSGQTKGGDKRFYKRGFSMPSTYYTDMDEPYSTKDQIMQVLANAIRQSPDDTTSTQEIKDFYKLRGQEMPKYKKGGKVKKDDVSLSNLINAIAKKQSKDFGTGVGDFNIYSDKGKEINRIVEAFNKLEIPGRWKSNVDWEYGDTLDPKRQDEKGKEARLLQEYLAGAVSEDIPLETGSSDMYSIFNPRHPDFIGF
jgi:hypothetical protein